MANRILLLLVLALGSVPVGAGHAQAVDVPDSEPMLHVGDHVNIEVYQREELSGEFPVAADGSVFHPLYREVIVTNVPIATAEARLREFLQRFDTQNPRFVMEPLFRVYVGGNVGEARVYALPAQTTIAQAVTSAGGSTAPNRSHRLRLIRDGEVYTTNLWNPDAGLLQEQVRSGDQILLQTRPSVFRDYIAPVAQYTSTLISLFGAYLFIRSQL